MLQDPFGFKSRFPVPEDEVKDVEAFWNLMDEIEDTVVGNTEDNDGESKRRRWSIFFQNNTVSTEPLFVADIFVL